MRVHLALASVTLVAAAGCASGGGVGPAHTTVRAASRIQGPHVATGTRFRAQLYRELDLSGGGTGQPFEAVLTEALRSDDGVTLASGGALVHGIVAVGARTGRLTLRSATVDTPVGPVDMRVALHTGIPGEDDALAADDAALADGAHPAQGRARPERAALTPVGAASRNPFLLPRGTAVELELTRALAAPGASVLRAR